MNQFAPTQLTGNTILTHLSEHQELLKNLGVVRLGLFGSYVRNEHNPQSDLDFLVSIRPMSYTRWMDVWNFLEDTFGLEVDLVPEEALRPEFRSQILNEVRYVEGL
jgi:uncharacterized protein